MFAASLHGDETKFHCFFFVVVSNFINNDNNKSKKETQFKYKTVRLLLFTNWELLFRCMVCIQKKKMSSI